MPSKLPIVDLPSAFSAMAKLADEMPIQKLDGLPGLLATYQLGPRIDRGDLPDLTAEIDNLTTVNGEPDLHLVSAIFRDYSFLASAYLLEPCWEEWEKTGKGYGLGRQVLPRCLAGPLVKTAKMLEIPPFMAYAAAYSLYNYRFADHSIGYDDYNNLRLIRAFERGLDPKSSEAGFILTHVDMVKHSGSLVKGAVDLLKATESSNHASAVDALDVLLESMTVIEASMETMWAHSKPKEYLNYRTFIFGITNQTMFPNGVVYEGENEGRPMNFRGESGANDAMIPLLDSLLQIQMPPNPLTTILKDFRNYRPKPHRDFLAAVRQEAEDLGVRTFACKDLDTRVRYLRLLNHVRSFRWRHWMFTREYIIKYSSHPTATGGSPIILWLPNQLFAVMDMMVEVWDGVTDEEKAIVGLRVNSMMDEVEECRAKLRKEVDKYCSERGQ
ncbi:Indoleamine 2,3-dioxygenase [Teratosphaeria destructans]|uniref:Indoleamine 2,3-dioxygenase n=1 Tax=Teratosphaeria destructans TaxID=418781 RepID=A0A9W7SKA1_9PEZI|nr:Indoleamine 2,3-dioxygenase [Teratosphaeria destructans]